MQVWMTWRSLEWVARTNLLSVARRRKSIQATATPLRPWRGSPARAAGRGPPRRHRRRRRAAEGTGHPACAQHDARADRSGAHPLARGVVQRLRRQHSRTPGAEDLDVEALARARQSGGDVAQREGLADAVPESAGGDPADNLPVVPHGL